jgi:glutathione synthase/RimK-type ligase-like ATP-grasp enzyme
VAVDVVLVTGRDMPIADVEGPQIAERLRDRGVSAEVRVWGADDCADAGLVVVRSTWDYTERRDEFVQWLRAVATNSRVVNPPSVVEWNSHKKYLLELSAAGIPVVPTEVVVVGASAAAQRAALTAVGDRAVVKPAVGAGARGAMLGRTDDPELAELASRRDVLVQPYAESIASSGETSLLFFHGELSHAVQKLPGTGDYRIHEHLGGSTKPYEPGEAEIEVAGRALAQVAERLTYARVDLVQLDDGPAVMELELIEPYLFLSYAPGSEDRFTDALVTEVSRR